MSSEWAVAIHGLWHTHSDIRGLKPRGQRCPAGKPSGLEAPSLVQSEKLCPTDHDTYKKPNSGEESSCEERRLFFHSLISREISANLRNLSDKQRICGLLK